MVFQEGLKVEVEGGKGLGITSMDIGVETLTWKLRLVATKALWMLLRADARMGARWGDWERTSLPTEMAVMLVEGT